MARRMALAFGSRFLGHKMGGKIKVAKPIVEMDGDEMARVIWKDIKYQLLLPYLDMETEYFDLGLSNRDHTEDRVTTEAAEAVREHYVGVKCPTITPDDARMEEYHLKEVWRSPNATIRNILNGTVFREPIVVKNVYRSVPGWTEPIIVARHANADQYLATDFVIDRPGTLEMVFHPRDKSPDQKWHVVDLKSSGIALGMYNVEDSIRNFALSCFEFALERRLPLILITKNTILKQYDGAFKNIFSKIYETRYKKRFEGLGLKYEHHLIEETVARVLRGKGGLVWASKNYDGDVQSNMVAQGYGSLSLMTSVLICPDRKTMMTEPAHGTITHHFRQYERGHKPSTNPVAIIFAWTRALAHRAKLDETPDVIRFCEKLETACVKVMEEGGRTKDLVNLEDAKQRKTVIQTQDFLDRLRTQL